LKKSTAVLGSVASLIVLFYTLGCAYLWSQQTRFIFRPQRQITSTPADTGLSYEDVFIPVAGDSGGVEQVHAWWIPSATADGPTLLYLHGSALNISANVEHAKRYQSLGFSVMLLSYRGYGRSDGDFPSETKIYQDAEAAWQYLVTKREIAPDDIVIYGHSLGGAIAQLYGLKYSNEIRALVLIATGAKLKVPAARLAAYKEMISDRAAWRKYVEGIYNRIAPEVGQTAIEARIRIGPEVILNDFLCCDRFDILDMVHTIKLPTLVICGSQDEMTPVKFARYLSDKINGAALVIIEGASHWVFMEKPKEVNQAIEAFIAGLG